jgi:L-threonylcarbamoyladenylate synthase
MLEEELGEVCLDPTMFSVAKGQAPKAPGMKYKHYAPKGELTIVSGTPEQVTERIQKELAAKKAQGFRTGVIATQEEQHLYLADSVKVTGSRDDLAAVARDLFRLLREFDDEGIEFMYVEAFPEKGIGQALMNRMLKAAGHRVIDAGENNPKQEI